MILKINNLNIFYEEYGDGKPIIFLHGNREDSSIFSNISKKLESKYKVYILDTRCHGKSEHGLLTYENIALDIIEFISKLEIVDPIVCGFSDGAIAALLVAIKEKKIASKLILMGVNYNYKGIKFFSRLEMKISYFFKRDKYIRLMLKEPNVSISSLREIESNVVLLFGKNDLIKKKHINNLHKNIINSRVEILENEDHYSYVFNNNKLLEVINKYLD